MVVKPDNMTVAQHKYWYLSPPMIISAMDGLSNVDLTFFIGGLTNIFQRDLKKPKGYFDADKFWTKLSTDYKKYPQLLVWDGISEGVVYGGSKPDAVGYNNLRADDWLADQKYRKG